MIWLIILIIMFLAIYVYFSVIIAAGLVRKINDAEAKIKALELGNDSLFENDEWCEKEIKSLSSSSDDLYDTHMTDISAVWKKMDELNNDINRAKMRIGKLEQMAEVENSRENQTL